MIFKKPLAPAVEILWNLVLIVLGSFLCALAIKGILIPNQFLAGGFTGLALLLHYVVPSVPVGVAYFVLNVPNFMLGWFYVGRRFFFYSLVGMLIFSLSVMLPFPELDIDDLILCALTAGILTGIGSGLILRSLGSAGGMDILAVIIYKKLSIRIGATGLAFNVVLLLAAAIRIPLDIVLYTLIYIYVTSYMVNLVVTGFNQRKAVMIISKEWRAISDEIMSRMHRGVTVVQGEGGFTGQPMRILYAVITFAELSRFKNRVRQIDPEAFVVITETLEVMGKGIGNQPHW
jgi:uncharacterized membrane-anchored protein YitT (DUF2179 family)